MSTDREEDTRARCESCGHLLVEYSFNMNKGLCAVLTKLFEARGPIAIEKLGFTNSQYSNYPKLAYWGLAQRVYQDGNAKGGLWEITFDGVQFIRGKKTVSKTVVMKNKVLQRFEGLQVYFDKIFEGYDYRPFYREQAVMQFKSGELF